MIVESVDEGKRLDKYLSEKFPTYSRTYFQTLIDTNLVLVNGVPTKKRVIVCEGDEIEIEFALTPEISLEPENIPLLILYEDDALIAIDKPAGMVVHPGAGNFSKTFVNALLYHCKQLPQQETLRPGIVHRLDKDTSGVMVAAKTERAHQKLVEMFSSRLVSKEYNAICVGNPGNRTIIGRIGRHPTQRKKMAITEKGKEAKTVITTIAFNGTLSFLSIFPETGRTHQIRVHLQSIGTPILGDSVYGNDTLNKKYHIERQLLHARRLKFKHPLTEEPMELEAPLPPDFFEI